MEALWVLVLAAAVVLLCLGLVVLLGNPEQLDPPDRKGRPVYPDRQVSPELRERLAEAEEAKTPTKATGTTKGKMTRTTRARANRKDD